MAIDLWGFKNVKDLEKNTSDFPETILKEQISALGDKTGFVLYGKPIYMKVTNHEVEYGAATIFNVIVPALDDYSKTVLIMYSNFEQNYPVAISVGKSFSEDMDFSLLAPNENFDFTHYFQPIIDQFAMVGREVEIRKKDKKNFGKVESAFLKDNTDVYDITFQTEKSVKIKIEVDTQPPLKFQTEQKLLLLPQSFMTRCFTLPALFAGKMHALVFRAWKNRVKGRDWYDFEWYVRHNVPLDFTHLCERALQFNHEELDKETFLQKLNERLATADMNQIKADVLPFVRNPKELDIWSNDYFMELAKMIRFE